WKTATLAGSARLYYVRFRTVNGGTAPVAATVKGRDYVGARGTSSGTIPAFDYTADNDHDGYINDAEYAHRAPGMDPRFVYESRASYAGYRPQRFPTPPSNAGFRNWAVQYNVSLLQNLAPTANLFVDNSGGNFAVNASRLLEPTASYTLDYATLL